jgi:perosamine synthetase
MNLIPSLDIMTISIDGNLRTAIECITNNSQGICFITEGKIFKGLITDGDLRRALLAGAEKDSPVREFMKKDPVTLPMSASPVEVQQALTSDIKHIPLLDLFGNLVDYVSKNHFQRVALAEPLLSGNELLYVTECIESNWISSKGRFVTEFENMFATFHNMPFAVSVSNGTVALSLALESIGIGKGDEVIVPDLTFAASINAIIHVGATPVIVDVNQTTWTIDPERFAEAITPKTKAVMPVHLYGHPADMEKIEEISRINKILIIEDCAESIGSRIGKRATGSYGDASCFSFFGNKTITTGEGGMILFKDQNAAKKARILRDHGMSPERRYWHEVVGYNYRITNIQAAIGVAQMERINYFINQKRKLAALYSEKLKDIKGIVLPPEASWAFSTYWLYSLLVLPESGLDRDLLIRSMSLNGIETRAIFIPLHAMNIYKQYTCNKTFPISKYISEYGICLPTASTTTDHEVSKVVEVFKTSMRSIVLKKELHQMK